ncbi:MAG: serine--tRNA ligase [Candidatus Fermentibacter daniensis]|jgi:seryl-tRNA synthetase|nr:serine--tRNA ligase [Candidatus Fermentibacter sp.]NLI01807.1 serine--tRNA ligase [Candidatus Fermentibacter daniensis]MCC6872066.1 serine--tRNA ligase [Candidatus Fermentibacter sp.]HOA05339.1 serine--tRNA ligase [Candidatus Fermentibacter daniensis]HOG55235.1 serine--tRNA ligase [Candidatus Fermentibacter daniensis]
MLDRELLRHDPEKVRQACESKNEPCRIDRWLACDEARRNATVELDGLRRRRNELSRQVSAARRDGGDAAALMEEARGTGDGIQELEAREKALGAEMETLELSFPNIPDEDVPRGRDASANVVLREWGEKPAFDFEPRPHWDLLEGVLDFEAAGRIAGSNFILLRGWAARLQRTLISWMLDRHSASGMEEIWPPFLASADSMTATGQLPKLGDDMYSLPGDGLYLIPTGEVPVTNLYRGETLDEKDLPVRMCCYTPCFRREAGSYGRETRGLNRVHQFEKVEMVRLEHPDRSSAAHEEMIEQACSLLRTLGVPYRVMLLSTGDLSFSAARCCDLEIWSGGQQRWLEVSSVSNFRDFQARRGNIRFRPAGGGKTRFVHTLNGSGLALPRLIAALVENRQRADGCGEWLLEDIERLLASDPARRRTPAS